MDRKTFAKEIEDQFGPQLGKLTVESIRHLAERLDDTVTVNRVEYHNLQNKVLKLERQVYESSKTESEARGFRRGMDRYKDKGSTCQHPDTCPQQLSAWRGLRRL